ncbi:Hypothetical predicted protein [Paramuricea clavata]|uniref:Uncharacterized protein n=1 Tax=Paramuricea clavata TaxID=317549 RepID=A0A6S7FF51_PARCT|nr:Hypothetical predicted protein [Paramuricea clavata]
MADLEEKDMVERWSKGKIINHKNNTISMSANALQCMGFDHQLLVHFVGNAHADGKIMNMNGPRQKLPQYLLVNSLEQLKENVYFYFLWGDSLNAYTASLEGKQINIDLNLFDHE